MKDIFATGGSPLFLGVHVRLQNFSLKQGAPRRQTEARPEPLYALMESAASYAASLAGKTGLESPDVRSKRMPTISVLHGKSKKDLTSRLRGAGDPPYWN